MTTYSTAPVVEALGSDRLLTIQDVSACFGVCSVTASRIMSDTKHAIVVHRKKYILESDLLAYLREIEG